MFNDNTESHINNHLIIILSKTLIKNTGDVGKFRIDVNFHSLL